jgi:hypothetical protein
VRAFEADLATGEVNADLPPAHRDLGAIAELWWVDRDANFWHSRGAVGPLSVPAEDGRWSVRHASVAARQGGVRDVRRDGLSATRLN